MKILNKQILYTFIVGICVGITILMVYVAFSGKIPFLKAAGVNTGAADVNARYLDGYGTATATSSSKIYVSDASGYLPDGSVDSGAIVDGTVASADLAGSIDPSKISGTAWTSANDGVGSDLDAGKLYGISFTISQDREYCKTSTAYNGNLGGISGANAKCAEKCGAGFVFAQAVASSACMAGSTYINFPITSTTWPEMPIALKRDTCLNSCDDGVAWVGSSGCLAWTSGDFGEDGTYVNTANCGTESGTRRCDLAARLLCYKDL
ncbi:MAG: hypothetical protein PHV47_00625 [Candidatus Pacebacteria bacterium]|nr:hypothetical protein [Candidatus Paceibacterota bacterium]MDD5620978.1 hypothetical protein [Candidatus Paceibacterota bacterium]